MNRKCLHIAIVIVLGLVSSGLMTFSQILVAAPTGGTVVEGSATIGVNPSDINHQVITQTTPKAIINWSSFNIGAHEITEFVQPSASAIALNRIIGGDPSVILGTLKANGQVWLINPAGILFGRTATVDVAGLLATTADIANQDFMRGTGRYHFLQPRDRSTSVINQGQISIKDSGIAALVAPGVENSGVIEANLGTLVLASGTEYIVDFYRDGLIYFVLGQTALSQQPQSPEGHKLKDAVSNSGQLIANGGKILLTTSAAKQVVENLINMNGIIKANTVVKRQGQVILHGGKEGIVSVVGRIEAQGLKDGEKGGNVTITGNKVGLFDKAEINASGAEGGGRVLIGGDFQGKGSLPWAEAVFMGKEARIRADALEKGDGGTVVLWSEKSTRFYGDISTKGGPEGGNGGLIELSSHRWVDPKGKINASALKGTRGKCLLDPWDVSIVDAIPSTGGTFQFPGASSAIWVPDNFPSTVYVGDINGILAAFNDLEIQTAVGGGVDPGRLGDIVVTAGGTPINTNISVNVTLTLSASNNLIIDRDITGPGLTLVLIAPGTVSGTGAVNVASLQLNVGDIDIGFPNHAGGNPPTALSSVNGNTTGNNIGLLNVIGQGTHFFNGNDLFVPVPPPPSPPSPPVSPPTTTVISSALNTSNVVSSTSSTPQVNNNSSVVQTQQSSSAPSSAASPSSSSASTSPPPGSAPASTPPPEPVPSSSTPPPATPATSPIPTPTPSPASQAPNYSTADVPHGSNVIGGGPEGWEPIQTAEAAEGREGFAEGVWNPEAIEQTEEVGIGYPSNIEESKETILWEYPEQSSGPVNSETLADRGVAPDSMIAKQLRQQPIGPEGVNGIDIPVGAEGIGGSSFGQERIDTAAGAEGDESLVAKDSWSLEDIDLSPEYLENLGLERASPLSFWRSRPLTG